MDDSVRSFYGNWKKRYLRKGCLEGQYYVKFNGPGRKGRQCVSEGQGYGMMIMALMAGADPMARQIFDGLFRYYKAHPSKYNDWLMSWAQGGGIWGMLVSPITTLAAYIVALIVYMMTVFLGVIRIWLVIDILKIRNATRVVKESCVRTSHNSKDNPPGLTA